MKDLENVAAGSKLILGHGGYSTTTYVGTVERLTKTQIITTKGVRYNRGSSYRVGDAYGDRIIKIATQEDIDKIKTEREISNNYHELRNLIDAPRDVLIGKLDMVIEVAGNLKKLTT